MRRFELITCVVAGLFTRPQNYAELNRRLEHALNDSAGDKMRSDRSPANAKDKSAPI